LARAGQHVTPLIKEINIKREFQELKGVDSIIRLEITGNSLDTLKIKIEKGGYLINKLGRKIFNKNNDTSFIVSKDNLSIFINAFEHIFTMETYSNNWRTGYFLITLKKCIKKLLIGEIWVLAMNDLLKLE
jgi:hypothetical protein